MSTFVVYQDGIRCSEHGIENWNVDTFDTKREAEVFAFHWAYPFSFDYCKECAKEMEIGVEYDYSMGGFPIMMSIQEIK